MLLNKFPYEPLEVLDTVIGVIHVCDVSERHHHPFTHHGYMKCHDRQRDEQLRPSDCITTKQQSEVITVSYIIDLLYIDLFFH